MFEKNSKDEKYIRDVFTMEEQLYEKYISMRKIVENIENMKYEKEDIYSNSQEFKQGFIACVKIISSILLDM